MSNKQKDKEIDKHLKFLNEKLEKFLSGSKPADVLIIKSHLICEYYLNQILIVRDTCDSEEINKLSFHQKREKSLKKDDVYENSISISLKELNKLRNKVGHELDFVISESDIDNLGFTLGKEYVLIKYDFDDKERLIKNVLQKIIVKTSLPLFLTVEGCKKKIEAEFESTHEV